MRCLVMKKSCRVIPSCPDTNYDLRGRFANSLRKSCPLMWMSPDKKPDHRAPSESSRRRSRWPCRCRYQNPANILSPRF